MDISIVDNSKYLTPAIQIDSGTFYEMLNVLPPMNWVNDGVIESFMMCEYFTGTVTSQYAKKDNLYIYKQVDTADKSTWVTQNDFSFKKKSIVIDTVDMPQYAITYLIYGDSTALDEDEISTIDNWLNSYFKHYNNVVIEVSDEEQTFTYFPIFGKSCDTVKVKVIGAPGS